MRYLFNAILLILICGAAPAQDIHFSQFFNSPLNLNPANTGIFDGDYRFAANYRNQWKSVTIPYSTFSFSADALNPAKIKNLGAGLLINQDVAGDSHFKTFQLNVLGTFIKKLDKDSTQILSLGVLTGFTSRSIDYDALYFDQQFNGVRYDESLNNGETFQRESRMYPNLNLGALYYKRMGKREFISAGISWNNITKPKQSYFNVNQITLDRKFNFHASACIAVNEKIEIIPLLNIQQQGKYNETILGTNGRYVLVDEKGVYRAALAGVFYRFKDALYAYAGFEYDRWQGGISYDVNLSDLTPASNNRGAIELSVMYIIDVFNPKRIQHRICPNDL